MAQEACKTLQQLSGSSGQSFAPLMGQEIAVEGTVHQYRSKLNLPGFDQVYFEKEGNASPVFTARIVGFESLEAARISLDSMLQMWSYCLRGYTFYKEENCRLGCIYYVAPNESREVFFYASYFEEPEHSWYAITLKMPGSDKLTLPSGLTILTATNPPLELPEGKLDACETVKLYLKAGVGNFQDLREKDGNLKVSFPEALSSKLLPDGTLAVELGTQKGDEETKLDELYLMAQSMLNKCLQGWRTIELTREDDADFMNDRRWISGNQEVSLMYEIGKEGKGNNRLLLLIRVQ